MSNQCFQDTFFSREICYFVKEWILCFPVIFWKLLYVMHDVAVSFIVFSNLGDSISSGISKLMVSRMILRG